MKNFLEVELVDGTKAFFHCPHCKEVVIVHYEGNTAYTLPSYCQYCKKEIDPTGVSLYYKENSQNLL